MRTQANAGATVTFPNEYCHTNSRFAYIRFQRYAGAEANEDVRLSITYGQQTIALARKTDARGVAVFPVGGILSSLCDGAPFIAGVRFEVTALGAAYDATMEYVIDGYSRREIVAATEEGGLGVYPQVPFLVVYPTFSQQVFLPVPAGSRVAVRIDGKEVPPKGDTDSPFFTLDPEVIPWTEKTREIAFSVTGPKPGLVTMPVEVDPCTGGLFMRWRDKAGIPYLYRWSQEIIAEEASEEDEYMALDDNLNPYEVRRQSLTETRTLRSRRVRQEVYDLCRTVIAARSVEYLTEYGEWERCYVEEAEAEDRGEVLKNLTVEITQTVANL